MENEPLIAIAIVAVLFAALLLVQPQKIGGDQDSHGCYSDAGYSWCEASNRCIRIWEDYCDQATLEELAQGYCSGENVAAVYTCGNYIRVVSSLMGGGSTFHTPGENKTICPLVAPDSMSAVCRQLLLGSNCVEKKIC